MNLFGRPKRDVLVVGGSGFIGSHLMALGAPFVNLDLKEGADFIEWSTLLPKYRAIVFLAVNMKMTNTAYTYNESLYKALDNYMIRYPETHVIYTSSAAVYPDSVFANTEKTLASPNNIYGKGKLLGESYIQQYRNHTILRLSNVSSVGDGSGVVDRFMRGGRTIYGDGTAVRDYVNVSNVVEAIMSALEEPRQWRGIINVSSGRGLSVNDVWDLYGTGTIIYKTARRTDVACSVLDNTKMLKLFGELDESND